MPDEKQGNDQSVEKQSSVVNHQSSAKPEPGERGSGATSADAGKAGAPVGESAAAIETAKKETVQDAKAETAAAAPPPTTASADAKVVSPAAPPKPPAAGVIKPATPAAAGAAAAKPPVAGAVAGAAKPAAPPKPEGPKPLPWDSEIARRLKASYGSGLREASTYVGQSYLVVDKTIAHEVLSLLRDDGFDYCVDVTAVHYPKKDEPFELVY